MFYRKRFGIMNTSFCLEKSIHAVLYVANKLERKDFHKIFKVLYFADINHLSDYGRTITGDTYIAMNDGPVPSCIYDIFKALRGDGFFHSEAQRFSKYFEVCDWNFINPKMSAELKYLSASDVEYLDASLCENANLSWNEIREKSHGYAWSETPRDTPISVKNMLLEKENTMDYIDFVTEMNELEKISASI